VAQRSHSKREVAKRLTVALAPKWGQEFESELVDRNGVRGSIVELGGPRVLVRGHGRAFSRVPPASSAVGGSSFMIHVRHAATAIAAALCETVHALQHAARHHPPAHRYIVERKGWLVYRRRKLPGERI